MRMWMTNPRGMCRKHLLGEHVETHMFVGAMNKGVRVTRYAAENLLEFNSLHARHDALVKEMQRRGYNHNSPLPALLACRQVTEEQRAVRVDAKASLAELTRRCPDCFKLFNL